MDAVRGTTVHLDGRTAVVTGATRGLGLATARALCAAGCRVLVTYAHDEAAAQVALASLADLPGTAAAARADVNDAAAMTALMERTAEEFGHLDVFVHNVSSLHPMTAAAADPAGVRADLGTALDPLLHGAGVLAGLMKERGGRIVACSSLGARAVVPHYTSLGVAKAALESLVRYLAVELAPLGIAVNAVASAKLDTGRPPTAAEQRLARRSPSGRLTRPEDVADVIALLCTDQARWIRGQVITADGGLSLLAP